MAFNEKIRTPDIVEILDVKIFTKNAHPQIFVAALDRYDDVLDFLQLQILSPDQKAAIDAVASTPSASNPVVLKDDIPVYYPTSDLGQIRDAVSALVDLPVVVTPTGDTTSGSATVDNLSSMGSVLVGQAVSGAGIPASAYVLSVGVSSFTMNLLATATAVGTTLTLSPTLDDVRPVLTLSALYRWNGTIWYEFIDTGTLDHTQLTNQDGQVAAPQYRHLTQTEKSSLLSLSHLHSNLPILDLITDAGSGQIITAAERNRLPSSDEKDALAGTQGSPSLTNKFVTNVDPRLNTLKNPYVSVGTGIPTATFPGNTGAVLREAVVGVSSFDCAVTVASPTVVTPAGGNYFRDQDFVFFRTDGALPLGLLTQTPYRVRNASATDFNVSLAVDGPAGPLVNVTATGTGSLRVGGSNDQVKAIEILPQVFTFVGLAAAQVWSLQPESLLLESLTPRGATFQTTIPTELITIAANASDAPVTIRGIKFGLNANSAKGIAINRPYCVIEDCVFTGGAFTGLVGLTANAPFVVIKRCKFKGTFAEALIVNGEFCRIEDCEFDLVSSVTPAVSMNGSYGIISSASMKIGQITIASWVTNTQISDSNFSALSSVIDNGTDTRFIHSPSAANAFGQPFLGRKRTIGPSTSFADYRGDTQAVFVEAFADPLANEFEVFIYPTFPFSYQFASSVTIPSGKKLKGVLQAGVYPEVSAAPGIPAFILSDNSTIETMSITTTAAPTLTINNTTNVVIDRCKLNLSGPDTSDDFGVYCLNSDDVTVSNTVFTGLRGISVSGGSRHKFLSNVVQTTSISISFDPGVLDAHVKDNHFTAGSLSFAGSNLIIEGNHFLGVLPSKGATVSSVWENNYPHPAANNFAGVDTLKVELDKYLESRTPGCQRTAFLDFGTLAFTNAAESSAVTLPVKLGGEVDTTATYTTTLRWTSDSTAGDVYWRITTVFRDRNTGLLGAPNVQTVVSPRTNLTFSADETVSLSFPATYGVTTPTHVSVEVSRLALDGSDTLPTSAYLLQAQIDLKRL